MPFVFILLEVIPTQGLRTVSLVGFTFKSYQVRMHICHT